MFQLLLQLGVSTTDVSHFPCAYIPVCVRLLIEVVASVASGVAGIVPHASLFMFVTVTSIR